MKNLNTKLTLWEYCQRKKLSIDEVKASGYEACILLAKRVGCELPSKNEFENLKPLPLQQSVTEEVKVEEKNSAEETEEMKKILAEIPTRQKQNILDSRVVLTDSLVQPGNNVEGEESKSENLSEELTSVTSALQSKKKKVLL